MLQSAIARINYIYKLQKLVKGLKFGDRQNKLDNLISTGVNYTSSEINTENQGVNSEIVFKLPNNISIDNADDDVHTIDNIYNKELVTENDKSVVEIDDISDGEESNNENGASDNEDDVQNERERSDILDDIAISDSDDKFLPPGEDNVTRT